MLLARKLLVYAFILSLPMSSWAGVGGMPCAQMGEGKVSAEIAAAGIDHASMNHAAMDHSSMDHSGMNHSGMDHDEAAADSGECPCCEGCAAACAITGCIAPALAPSDNATALTHQQLTPSLEQSFLPGPVPHVLYRPPISRN